MKNEIDVYAFGTHILQSVNRGVLLNSQANGRLNTMAISWGAIGTCWGKPIFTTYVRKSRFTHDLLEENPVFTVSLPFGDYDKQTIAIAGSTSGRDGDKIAALGLTPFPAQENGVSGFREFPFTLECKVLYRQDMDGSIMDAALLEKNYPADAEGIRDLHTVYYGEIVAAYLEVEDPTVK